MALGVPPTGADVVPIGEVAASFAVVVEAQRDSLGGRFEWNQGECDLGENCSEHRLSPCNLTVPRFRRMRKRAIQRATVSNGTRHLNWSDALEESARARDEAE